MEIRVPGGLSCGDIVGVLFDAIFGLPNVWTALWFLSLLSFFFSENGENSFNIFCMMLQRALEVLSSVLQQYSITALVFAGGGMILAKNCFFFPVVEAVYFHFDLV